MSTDQEYLSQAGITDENPNAGAAVASETPQAPVDMFELGEHKMPVNTEFKIPHNGEVLKVPYTSLINSYRQNQHYQDKWAKEYKPKIEEFEKLRPQFDQYKGFYDKYGQIQEWSEKNPDQWSKLWDLYQNKDQALAQTGGQPTQQSNMYEQKIAALEAKLGGLEQFKSSFEQKQEEEKVQQDTQMILGEAEAFQKEYPEIDLNERDPDGVSLRGKIMQYGIQEQLPNFKFAAMAYLESRLKDTWSSRARNESVKGIQKDTQQGIVKRSSTPLGKVATPTTNVKNKSYSELAELAKSQYSQVS